MISKFEGMKNKIPGLGKPKQPPNQPQKKEPAKIIPQKPEIKPKPPIEKSLPINSSFLILFPSSQLQWHLYNL